MTPGTTRLLTTITTMVLLAAAPATAQSPPRASDNMELVASIRYADGTDLELFSRDLRVWKGRDGAMVEEEAPVTRHFAMAGAETSGARIVDVTDPEDPYVVAQVPKCAVYQGDVQLTPDARTAAIAFQIMGTCATEDGKLLDKGGVLVDLTDLYNPRVVAGAPFPGGAHNVTIHPSGDHLYVSTASQIDPISQVGIFDISDPRSPQLVTTWESPGNSPHDISFNADGTRAYMAGISQTRIVDTSDPESPELISTVTPPGGTIGHDAWVSPDGAYLFVGDEAAGGNAYPCPGGAIYVYDIRDEAEPDLLGAAWAGVGPVTARNEGDGFPETWNNAGCTAHVMSMNPGGRSLTVAWYSGGTRVLDFSGLYDTAGDPAPGPVATWGSTGDRVVETAYMIPDDSASTWAAKQYAPLPGYVFSNDNSLGFYVSRITD